MHNPIRFDNPRFDSDQFWDKISGFCIIMAVSGLTLTFLTILGGSSFNSVKDQKLKQCATIRTEQLQVECIKNIN